MNEVASCAEMHAEIIILMVLARNVEGIGDMLFRVTDVNVFASSQQGTNVVLYICYEILRSVSGF